jgi:hypothetical protein
LGFVEELLMSLSALAVLVLTLGGFWLLATRSRRRGTRAMLSVVDEIWHPTGQVTHIEVQAQAERRVPLPAPDDRL